MWDKCNYLMVSIFLSTTLLGMRIDFFQSCGHFWIFQIFSHIEYNTLMASSFRILNSSTGIPLHPLVLLIAVLPTAPLTFFYRMSGSEWLTTPSSSFCSFGSFYTVLLCILSISSWSLQCLLDLYHLCPLLCPSLYKKFPWYLQFSWRDL